MREKHKSRVAKDTSRTEFPLLDDSRLHELIASRAYELYEKRGFMEGHDCEDWLEAERQILADVETKPVLLQGTVTQYAA